MMTLVVVYGQSDPAHVHRWTCDVTDVETARRVAGQLWRRIRRTACPDCSATHYTVSTKRLATGLWAIAATGELSNVSSMSAGAGCDPMAPADHPRDGGDH